MRLLLFILLFINMLASCNVQTKFVKYPERKNEFYSIKNLKTFLKNNDSPKVVLRVNEFRSRAVEVKDQQNQMRSIRYLYTMIEDQLVKEGYSVKDRNTFNDIISKTSNSEILKKELADADLIFEVVNMDDRVLYTTDTVSALGSRKSTVKKQGVEYKSLGAYVEYRIILVKTNEIAGSYKFNYQPCGHGCMLDEFKFTGKKNNREIKLPDAVPDNDFQQFIRTSLGELFQHFREG